MAWVFLFSCPHSISPTRVTQNLNYPLCFQYQWSYSLWWTPKGLSPFHIAIARSPYSSMALLVPLVTLGWPGGTWSLTQLGLVAINLLWDLFSISLESTTMRSKTQEFYQPCFPSCVARVMNGAKLRCGEIPSSVQVLGPNYPSSSVPLHS